MIDTRHDRDWGPSPAELLTIARRSGCVVELGRTLHDGTQAYEISCSSHAAKVKLLAALAEYDSRHPEVIRLAEKLAATVDGDPWPAAQVIHAFVRDGVRFLPEPREKFQPTGRTLALGIGDCDDTARAVMALLRAAGLRGGLLTLGDPPRHVSAAVQLGGSWRWLDASIAAMPGEHPVAAAQRLGLRVRPELGELGQARVDEEKADPTVANMVTIAGFGMGVAWAVGGHDAWGVASIIADEVDGWVARELGEQSEFGGLLDWGTDLALTPLVWGRVGLPWRFLPLVTAAQIGARHYGYRPRFGSIRAALMGFKIAKDYLARRKREGR